MWWGLYNSSHFSVYFRPTETQKDKWMTGNSELAGTEASPSLCCCSVAQLCLTLCNPMDCSTPGFPVLHCLPEFAPLSQWCHPTTSSSVIPFSSCPHSFPVSGSFQMSQLFTSGGQSIEFQLNISPSSQHPGLISFRMDWLNLLAVQGTLKSLLQHNSSKASILRCSAFLTVQLSIHIWPLEKP